MPRQTILFLALLLPLAEAQTADQKPVFEAASIKMAGSVGGRGHSHSTSDPGMFRASMTLQRYIVAAYDLEPYQVTGGPNWINDTAYEIVAKLENPQAPLPEKLTPQERSLAEEERIHQALQTLLAERFQLKFHHETKEIPGYALTVSKSAFKLKPASEAEDCGVDSSGQAASLHLTATCIDMAGFARFLMRETRMPVANETNIQGVYSFTMDWASDDLKPSAASNERALPSLFTVLDHQLGLRLESKKARMDILVIDSAERPPEN
jgi:bla regulator protein blaR1